MIYVIDHNDSFTQNVVHQLSLFDKVECDNYNRINRSKLKQAKVIIFSPGPGNPKNYPSTSKIYYQFKGKKKMIGICLGFQQILFCEGAKIVEQNKIYHGYQSRVKVINKSFNNKEGKEDLSKFYGLNEVIIKVIFIGLASLTFPHILLEYLLEINEKRN